MISRALRPACTLALGPIVRRCSWHSTVPSTSPSIVRSSRAKICPFTVTFLPNAAAPPRTLDSCSKVRFGDDIVLASLLDASIWGEGIVGVTGGRCSGLAGTSSSLLLLHIQNRSPDIRCLHGTTPGDCYIYESVRVPGLLG